MDIGPNSFSMTWVEIRILHTVDKCALCNNTML